MIRCTVSKSSSMLTTYRVHDAVYMDCTVPRIRGFAPTHLYFKAICNGLGWCLGPYHQHSGRYLWGELSLSSDPDMRHHIYTNNAAGDAPTTFAAVLDEGHCMLQDIKSALYMRYALTVKYHVRSANARWTSTVHFASVTLAYKLTDGLAEVVEEQFHQHQLTSAQCAYCNEPSPPRSTGKPPWVPAALSKRPNGLSLLHTASYGCLPTARSRSSTPNRSRTPSRLPRSAASTPVVQHTPVTRSRSRSGSSSSSSTFLLPWDAHQDAVPRLRPGTPSKMQRDGQSKVSCRRGSAPQQRPWK